ncbi:hypothetical protein CTEN210_02744 [Chaetoceros tenuissimus]|uniref:Uncharacterized protein n=1 Tax=Chaetoceros tenuissimus TaxID=426638 RepID=A0AAD3CJI6_9STRA|nr:hypothetical protein CTEN210_02744 [Chaetoceros tenuissimus]
MKGAAHFSKGRLKATLFTFYFALIGYSVLVLSLNNRILKEATAGIKSRTVTSALNAFTLTTRTAANGTLRIDQAKIHTNLTSVYSNETKLQQYETAVISSDYQSPHDVEEKYPQSYGNSLSVETRDVCAPSSTTTNETLWIAIPSWRDAQAMENSLDSISSQVNTGFQNIHVVLFDSVQDAQKRKYEQDPKLQITYVENNDDVSKDIQESSYRLWKVLNHIQTVAGPNEYTLTLNENDTFANNEAIKYMYDRLKKTKAWFAWSNTILHSSLLARVQQVWTTITEPIWSPFYTRVIEAHLLQHLTMDDFHSNGKWMQLSETNELITKKFIQISGASRQQFLDKIETNQTHTKPSTSSSLLEKEVIHVVACIYKRNNSQQFFSKFTATELPQDHVLKIHICNNSPDRQEELTSTAENVWKTENVDESRMSIDIVDMNGNHGGFARFLLAREIMQKEHVDYIIMVDDDQYVRPNTLLEVYNLREPQSYKTWFGKTWLQNESSYWKPFPKMTSQPQIRAGLELEISKYQYGGTGMSIIDASVFTIQELFELEERYKFLEDMWLSHVVLKRGWDISRLFVFFDSNREASASGQFNNLKEIKNEFFAKLKYFQCGNGKSLSQRLEQWSPAPNVGDSGTYDQFYWKDLPPLAKKAVEKLAFDEFLWDSGHWPSVGSKKWHDMTTEEKESLETLGYFEKDWYPKKVM